MSHIVGLIVGAVLIIVGLVLLIAWFTLFVKALMALVPVVLMLVGIGFLAYFISEIKSKVEIAAPEEKKIEEK